MSYITKYVEYLKDNPQDLWFKRKLYGWGWVPVKWEGWVVVVVSIVYIVWVSKDFGDQAKLAEALNTELSAAESLYFFSKIAITVVVMIAICYWKGEKPKWQWGLPTDTIS